MIEAGKAIKRLTLNLSRISQPNDCVAAIVVSEIIERLSPNMEPPNNDPAINGIEAPLLSAKLIAIGPKATIEPTEVPVAVDKKEAIKKIPKGKYSVSMLLIPKFTTASTAPMA
ncbi:hypothetical protein D3C86_1280540 [compost metagenome]